MAPKRQPTVKPTSLENIMRQAEREGLETVEMYDADDHDRYRPRLIQEAGSVEEAQRRGWLNKKFNPDNPEITVNAAGRAKWAELQGNIMSGARPTPEAGPSQRRRTYSDDDDDDYAAYHTPRGEITPRGPIIPVVQPVVQAPAAPVIPPPSTSTPYTITNAEGAFDSFKKRFFGKTKPDKDYEALIKKSFQELEKHLIEYENQQKTQKLTLQSIETLNKKVNDIVIYLTRVLSDEIAFDTTVGADLRLYLDGLIEKGVNKKLNEMLRMVMKQCIIPPLPRGKKYGDFDEGTRKLYDVAINAYQFVILYLPLSQEFPYVKFGNIKETMTNWKIWYDDQDDADDKKYKGFDISGYIIEHGIFPKILNVESGQPVEPVQTYGTTYRINFYYPNPWEASGTIKYFDVVLA